MRRNKDRSNPYGDYTAANVSVPGITLTNKYSSTWPHKAVRFINGIKWCPIKAACNRYEGTLSLYSKSLDARLYRDYGTESKFVNIGAGGFSHSRWTNYDLRARSNFYKEVQGVEGKDFHHLDLSDFTELPMDNSSIDLIYCSHVIEHLELDYGKRLLDEFNRILKPGGVARIVIPSQDYYLKAVEIMNKSGQTERAHQAVAPASKLLNENATNFTNNSLIKMLEEASFDILKFEDSLMRESSQGISADPSAHLSYWNAEHLVELGLHSKFSEALVLLRTQTMAEPFKNKLVFDNTESHISQYVELLK